MNMALSHPSLPKHLIVMLIALLILFSMSDILIYNNGRGTTGKPRTQLHFLNIEISRKNISRMICVSSSYFSRLLFLARE
jgi:hypothetical protein